MLEFQIGQNALDVCKVIVSNQAEISAIRLVAHEVDNNWRQVHQTALEKLNNLLNSFEHSPPIKDQEYSREEFSRLSLNKLNNLGENQVWSITSRVRCSHGRIKHLPLMNFHPEEDVQNGIISALRYICGNNNGALLDSGRFQHYYGDFLLDEHEWTQFMAEFLMPVFLVSPRYIGHRLYEGYSTLRLTSDNQYKPKIPEVIAVL